MCYYLNFKERVKIAKKDLVVYKSGHPGKRKNVFIPAFRTRFRYYKDVPTVHIDIVPTGMGTIMQGYHFWLSKPKLACKRVKCIIPKGTRYYSNRLDGVGVAEQLIFIEFL